MLWQWMAGAWRTLKANPFFTLITIASLSIGCCGALLAGANIQQHMSFERWNPVAERVVALRYGGNAPGAPNAAAVGDMLFTTIKEELKGHLPAIEAQSIVLHGASGFGAIVAQQDGEPSLARPLYTDEDFFELFPMRFIEGDMTTALKQPGHVVLTQSEARRRFGSETALGKTIDDKRLLKSRPVVVDGIVPDFPANTRLSGTIIMRFSDLAADMGLPLDQFFQIDGGTHYLKLAPGVTMEGFVRTGPTQIADAVSTRIPSGIRLSLVPLVEIHLADRLRTGVTSSGDTSLLLTLASAAGVLLVVCVFNYVLLSVARTLRRRPEVAIRKVLGADRGALVVQYLTESAVITGVSLFVGFFLAELLRPLFAQAIGQPDALTNLYDPAFVLCAIAGWIILTLIVSAYPAIYLANTRPRMALPAQPSGPPAIVRLLSGGMVGLQVAAATVLAIVAFVMIAQSSYVASRPLGFELRDTYVLRGFCPQTATDDFDYAGQRLCLQRFIDQTKSIPGVETSGLSTLDADFVADRTLYKVQASPAGAELGLADQVRLDPSVLKQVKATLLAGRLFYDTSAYDRQLLDHDLTPSAPPPQRIPAVVTAAMLPMLGAKSPADALGKTFFMPTHENARSLEVVGVVADWHQRTLRDVVSPIVFVVGQGVRTYPLILLSDGADLKDVEPLLREAWTRVTGMPGSNLELASMQKSFSQAYESDQRLMWTVSAFALVAIIVASLGVFGMTAFDMGRRVRETGVRKALGASTIEVAAGMLKRHLVSAFIASLAAWPIGYWIAREWLLGYAYRTDAAFVVLPIASLAIILIVALAISLNVVRASAVGPARALASI